MTELTKKKVDWLWSTECDKAFQELKLKLSTAPVLAIPDPAAPFEKKERKERKSTLLSVITGTKQPLSSPGALHLLNSLLIHVATVLVLC